MYSAFTIMTHMRISEKKKLPENLFSVKKKYSLKESSTDSEVKKSSINCLFTQYYTSSDLIMKVMKNMGK